jgi:hypothetical protein
MRSVFMRVSARIWLSTLAVCLCVAPSAFAGEVTGRIWVLDGGQKRVASGATVVVTCGGAEKNDAANAKGDYRVQNVGSGSCWVHVLYEASGGSLRTSTKARLFVSDDGASANLQLVRDSDGWSLTLR